MAKIIGLLVLIVLAIVIAKFAFGMLAMAVKVGLVAVIGLGVVGLAGKLYFRKS